MNDDVLYEAGFSFEITALGLRVEGLPTPSEWAEAGHRLADARNGTLWAIGDWLLYAETRGFEDGVIEAASSATGLKKQTLYNCKRVAKAIPLRERLPGLSWSHHHVVAGCEPEVRSRLMSVALDEHLSVEDLTAHVKEINHHVAQQTQTFPVGTFGLIYAQAPWYSPRLRDSAVRPMTADQLASLAPQVQKVCAPDCVLYFGASDEALVSGEALTVVRAWGFTPKASHVWVRDIGEDVTPWMRNRHEHVIVAVRGTPVPPRLDVLPDSVVEASVPGDGRLPSEVAETLEVVYPDVPRLVLFTSEPREGWETWRAVPVAAPRGRAVRLRDEPVEIPA